MGRTRKEQLNVAERAALPFAVRISNLIDTRDCGNASELAKILQCSSQAISQFRNGNAYPKIDNLIKIADYYHVSTDYLLGLTVDPNKQPCAAEQLGISQENIEFLAYGKGIYQDGLEEYRLAAIRSFCNSLFDVLRTNHTIHQYIAEIEDLHFSEDKYKDIDKTAEQSIAELYIQAGKYGLVMLSPSDAAQYYISSVMDSLKESIITSVQKQWGEMNNGKTE